MIINALYSMPARGDRFVPRMIECESGKFLFTGEMPVDAAFFKPRGLPHRDRFVGCRSKGTFFDAVFLLRFCRPKNKGGISSSETKRIGHGVIDGTRRPLADDYTKTTRFFVKIVRVDCRRNNLVSQGQHGDPGFKATGAAEKMACHGFCRSDE